MASVVPTVGNIESIETITPHEREKVGTGWVTTLNPSKQKLGKEKQLPQVINAMNTFQLLDRPKLSRLGQNQQVINVGGKHKLPTWNE